MNPSRLLVFLLLIMPMGALAQRGKQKHKLPGEQVLVYQIVSCLQAKDEQCYIRLFPDTDTLSQLILRAADKGSAAFHTAQQMQQDGSGMMQADSSQRARLTARFDTLIAFGEKHLNLNWNAITPMRFELQKMHQTRDKFLEKLAPNRYRGYVFVLDQQSGKSYGISIEDILEINSAWYGGWLGAILPGSTIEEFEAYYQVLRRRQHLGQQGLYDKSPAEQKQDNEDRNELKIAVDTLENSKTQKIVAERHLYSGQFDQEINVQLYIRTLQGGCPGNADGNCLYDAIYKFGDQDQWIKLAVHKNADGSWHFDEIPEAGTMDLELVGGSMTGEWTAADGQTGYNVRLSEIEPSAKKVQYMDEILLKEQWMKY